MPDVVLWTRYFLRFQGYNVSHNIVYLDNQSAMLLERNGKASSSTCTKHIKMQYYFVKDRIDSNKVTIKWCPTKDIADFMTKPLQGAAFTTTSLEPFHLVIGNKSDCHNCLVHSLAPQECVGRCILYYFIHSLLYWKVHYDVVAANF